MLNGPFEDVITSSLLIEVFRFRRCRFHLSVLNKVMILTVNAATGRFVVLNDERR